MEPEDSKNHPVNDSIPEQEQHIETEAEEHQDTSTELELRAQDQAPAAPEPDAQPAQNIGGEQLTLEDATTIIAQLREGNRTLRDRMLRSRADYENFKRRAERDVTLRVDDARMSMLRQCLDIVDNFDRALEAVDDPTSPFAIGVKMIHKQLIDFLETNAVEEIASQGELFDPYLHEALAQEPTNSAPENTITTVFQKGYLYKDKLLRAAQVRVAVKPEEEGDLESESQANASSSSTAD